MYMYKISYSETELNILRIKICHRYHRNSTGSEHMSSKGLPCSGN